MIRFVDLSDFYWTDTEETGGSVCAFLNTGNDRFIETLFNDQVFCEIEDIQGHPQSEQLLSLLPENFFGTRTEKQ